MQNKKNNRIIMGVIIGLLVVLGVVYFILNYTKSDNSFSIVEKKWITSNINTVLDVNVYNDVPLYGYNGSGISLDFLDAFTDDYDIKFNKIPYYSNDIKEYKDISFRILNNNQKLGSNDILFYEDNYVVLSKDKTNLVNFEDIDNVGIMSFDKDVMSDYFNNEVEYKEFKKIDEAISSLKDDKINYLIVPNVMYMREILSNDLKIVLHLNDLSYKYVLNVSDDVSYSVMKKYYTQYLKDDYYEDYSSNFLNNYFISTNTSDLDSKNYNAKVYKYGYVVNMPYENYTTSDFVGTLSNYLKDFERVANVEIEVIKYNSIDDVKSALVSGEVDFALTNFDYDTINMENIISQPFSDLSYVVLSKDNILINSIKGLVDYNVKVIGSSNLHHLCMDNGIEAKLFMDTDDMIRNVTLDDVVVMDKYTYEYYKDVKLDDYKVVYEDKINSAYRFIINDDNKTFAGLFDYYISSVSYDKIRFDYNTNVMIKDDNNNMIMVVIIVVLIVSSVLLMVVINRRNNKGISLSREDMVKYIDPVTSLKNRNYLNHNIYTWDDNVIFPQSVMVFDINALSEINDKFGREVGDEVIKKVASILINNQLENTDIIRSGGDEFLIYMIGYDERDVIEYGKKIMKRMRDIPNSKGVEMGYSMILDEVKTVDDAINESITMMKKNKDKNKNS